MVTLKMEKECGCFKRSSFQSEQTFDTTAVALKEAKIMCKDMNTKFCHKHKFRFEQNENEIIIKMEIDK